MSKYITTIKRVEGVNSRCQCGWVFPLRLPEHGSTFVCPSCHRICGEA